MYQAYGDFLSEIVKRFQAILPGPAQYDMNVVGHKHECIHLDIELQGNKTYQNHSIGKLGTCVKQLTAFKAIGAEMIISFAHTTDIIPFLSVIHGAN